MGLLSEIEGQILVLHSQGHSARRVYVPSARRVELEREMRRSQGVRRHDDAPLHIMGILVCFEEDAQVVRFDYQSDLFDAGS
ncbi:hypothetical protein V3391_06455 [Luteimonas sp. SMYT11W]|uniref:Uncharacterized protein n=1 Tax=Luteimonas flava TaxID=3115822 RepID=A0ABU7WD18_9GAMM